MFKGISPENTEAGMTLTIACIARYQGQPLLQT